jgi:mannose-6-phosphate isomerase-like protein (cupin superfamily)
MAYKLARKGDSFEKNKFGIHLNVYPEINERCEVALVSTEEGHNQEFYDKKSSFTYLILEGSGTYYLDDEEVAVSAGDCLSVEPRTRIYYKGQMKMVLITSPAWREGNEVETRSSIW